MNVREEIALWATKHLSGNGWHVKLFYAVKNMIWPWNVIKLRRLDRSYQETDTLIEEALCQLLVDFFNGQQPFHQVVGLPYERESALSVDRHRQVLRQCNYDATTYTMWTELLDVVEWYQGPDFELGDDEVYARVIRSGGTHDQAIAAANAWSETRTRMLTLIVTHRESLWT